MENNLKNIQPNAEDTKGKTLAHRLFIVSLFIKGIDAILETAGAILLAFTNPVAINKFITTIAQSELSEDPNDFIFSHLVALAKDFSVSSQMFGVFYLLSHGVLKLLIVGALFKRKLWSYPAGMVLFSAFIIYQIYRFIFTHSIWLIVLTVFDLIVIYLTWLEYKSVKALDRKKQLW